MIDRRSLLAMGGVAVATAALDAEALAAEPRLASSVLRSDPYRLGVASGDASPTSVVLWTRLAPDPLDPTTEFGMAGIGSVPVQWRLATTPGDLESKETSLRRGDLRATRQDGFSVRTDVTRLQPDTVYYYRFEAAGWRSPIGRTRTAPAPDSARPITFAVVNCQNVAGGDLPAGRPNPFYFNGMAHLAARDDIDFVLHLGDYIYDFGRAAHLPPRRVESLADFRLRYAQYKTQPELLELHRRFPTYSVPDNHELSGIHGGTISPGQVELFNIGLHAYWEHLPLRGARPGELDATTPNNYRFHGQIRWGATLDLFLTDVRQYRTDDSILGTAQQDQLLSWLRGHNATWTTIATGTPMSWLGEGFGGKWHGYDADRNQVADLLLDLKGADSAGFNPVVLSGDFHCGIVTHLRSRSVEAAPFVATEFVNAPMSSGTTARFSPVNDPRGMRVAYNKGGADGNWENYRGYASHTVTPDAWTSEFFCGDQHQQPDGTVSSFGRWQIPAGADVGSVHEI